MNPSAPAFTTPFPVSLSDIHAEFTERFGDEPPHTRPPAAETTALAEERLAALGIIAGPEMRYATSLSPVALLRLWNVRLSVKRDRHDFTLEGSATTYGRSLVVAAARASCLMEMAERASAYLSIGSDGLPGLARPVPVREGARSSLLTEGLNALNPNEYPLEVPYGDESVLWMRGETADAKAIWIPMQMASLFCNPDEPALFDSLGSTGIATGRTMEEACGPPCLKSPNATRRRSRRSPRPPVSSLRPTTRCSPLCSPIAERAGSTCSFRI